MIDKKTKILSVFTLAMINVAALGSAKNWPFIAEFGFSSLFYFLLATLVFFFPVAFVSAELATSWPEKGGVYLWVKEAFGPKWGFLAVWLQWIENVAWYPTILSFATAAIAYIFNPALAESPIYTISMVLIILWGATFINFFGMRMSGWVSDVGALCGTLLPGILILVLGAYWLLEDFPSQIQFTLDSFFPKLNFSNMVFFTGVLLSFCGMEMSAVHATDVNNPQKSFPRAILLSVLIILILSGFGVLSISMVVPQKEINLTAGTMQAFTLFFKNYNLQGLTPFIAALIAVGAFGSVSTWIIGPTKGLLAAGQEGLLPQIFQRVNKHQAPTNLMLLQASIASVLSLLFLLMPTVSSGFWILTVLVAQLYLIMYILVLAAALRLRISHSKRKRAYKIPGGRVGMWIVCLTGILSSSFALLIGYIPPQQINIGSPTFYITFLLLGTMVGFIAPFLILKLQKSQWKK